MKMSFVGKFMRKDINTKKENTGDSSSNNESSESTVKPYIYTDVVYFDN